MISRRIILTVIGDANSPITWSGTPYYLLQAGKRAGLMQEGLNLSADNSIWKVRRALWNAQQVATSLDRPGGYQYSDAFLESRWSPVRDSIRGATILNCFQLLPPSLVSDMSVEKWFYVDMTLPQLFTHYGIERTIGRRIRDQALSRERDGYRAAAGVICHSHWAGASAVQDCGVDPRKVHIVVPGANLDRDAYEMWSKLASTATTRSGVNTPLRLVFVGKEWRRKGLDRLLRAYDLAIRKGASLTLRIVGCDQSLLPKELRYMRGVEWAGFVDKRTETSHFLNLIADCDVGCHLSRAEAGGIAQREFHALGLGILGTDVGGASEHRFANASVTLPMQATDDEVAEVLVSLASDRSRVAQMKRNAWDSRREALWPAAVQELGALLGCT